MTNDIKIFQQIRVGEGFVPLKYLRQGENEYRIRDEQLRALGKEPSAFRALTAHELEVLVKNNNTCNDWSLFLVMDPFCPELLRNNSFFGLVRISRLEHIALEHHDISAEAGIFNSQIIACDIGDNCVISNCAYISHYIIDDHCMLINNAEIQVSNHAKFGNGIIMESEEESVRITLDIMNENGGRAIYPFDGMLTGDAWLWAKFRDREALMQRLAAMTDAKFDRRLGRYGVIGRNSVLKHNRIIKDSYIGECAYIKGSNKLKNLTINSSAEATTQIGEGVELVNGILGYGCRVFYGCKAVRFVMCDNSALKYGARLIHSVLGENSTVSCCEILNNLIYPAHEQHHNTSFLIASLIKGQSNLAAGATIGSNHNSRAPDGEIEAGRGFWPGLCTSVKHSSRFASFCLLSKSDYKHELDIRLPFCLVDSDETEGRLVLVPGWWWYSNAYALMRNEKKFKERDKRIDRSIRYMYSPFAADTATEILAGLGILEHAAGECAAVSLENNETNISIFGDRVFKLIEEARTLSSKKEQIQDHSQALDDIYRKIGSHVLSNSSDPLPFEVRVHGFENSSRPQIILRACRAWKSYREMLLWFAMQSLLPEFEGVAEVPSTAGLFFETLTNKHNFDGNSLEFLWENLGGFLVRYSKVEEVIARIENAQICSWDELHRVYRELSLEYDKEAKDFAWGILAYLCLEAEAASAIDGRIERSCNGRELAAVEPGGKTWPQLSERDFVKLLKEAKSLTSEIARRVFAARAKDLANPFRKATFRNEAEQCAVCGKIENNSSIQSVREEMEKTRLTIERTLNHLRGEESF